MSDPSAPVVSAVIGTAGHIDHGKSALIEQLTGTHPSRLKEERERGMTIDIGYAELAVSDTITAGIIDVPGHEKFIRNMVAGSTGVDFVMLVVAADDGVMPQTREHLQIMRILGIERGMTVVTKIDAVDEELLELVVEEIREFLQGTFLEDAPMMRVSNITGEGIDAVREAVKAAVTDLPPKDGSGVFRMPVQRAFSVQGHGTIVTGVPTAGVVRPGDELEVLPRGDKVRVRGVQVHHAPATHAQIGHRTALNITDVSYRDINRGDVVAARGYFQASELLEARLWYLDHFDAPLRNGVPIRFHAGTADVGGRVVLLDHKVLLPGESGIVQIRLEEPVVVAAGDAYILRLASPVMTLGGGRILGETKWRFKRFRGWLNENLEQKEAHIGDSLGYLEYVVRSNGKHSELTAALAVKMKSSPAEIEADLQTLAESGRVRRLKKDRTWIHSDMFEQACDDAGKSLLELHRAERLQGGFQASQLVKATKLSLELVEEVIVEMVERKKFDRLHGTLVRHKEHSGGLSKEDMRLVGLIEEMHEKDLFGSPIRSEIVTAVGKPEKKVKDLMSYLFQMGILISVSPDLALHRKAMEEAERLLVLRLCQGGSMPSKDFKEMIDSTRKYVIPILEYFDKKGVTVRDGNERTLQESWETKVFDATLEGLGGE